MFRYPLDEPKIAAWIHEGNQAKIVVGVDSLDELQGLIQQAQERGVDHYMIQDAGHTEVEPGTITCCSFGPAMPDVLDPFLGQLKLR